MGPVHMMGMRCWNREVWTGAGPLMGSEAVDRCNMERSGQVWCVITETKEHSEEQNWGAKEGIWSESAQEKYFKTKGMSDCGNYC